MIAVKTCGALEFSFRSEIAVFSDVFPPRTPKTQFWPKKLFYGAGMEGYFIGA